MFSALGSVDCVGCSSAEDEMPNDSSPIQTKERKRENNNLCIPSS